MQFSQHHELNFLSTVKPFRYLLIPELIHPVLMMVSIFKELLIFFFLSQSCFVSVMSRNLKLFFHFKFFHFSIPITPVFSYNPFSFQFQSFQFLVPCLPVFQFQSFQFLVQILPVFSSNPFSFQFYPIQFFSSNSYSFQFMPSSFSVPILPVFSSNSSSF